MTAEFIIDPKHPEANIHGVVGQNGEQSCTTQLGKRCTACCFALYIDNGIGQVVKEGGEDCPDVIPQMGCRYVLEGRPKDRIGPACSAYHCSQDRNKVKRGPDRFPAWQRLTMENAAALKKAEITQAEAKENQVFRIGDQPINIEVLMAPGGMFGPGESEDRVDELAQWLIDNNI